MASCGVGRHSGTQGAVGAGRALPEVSSFERLGRRSGREGESTWGVARGLRMSEVGLLSAGLRYTSTRPHTAGRRIGGCACLGLRRYVFGVLM